MLRKFLREHISEEAADFDALMKMSGNQILFEIRIFVDRLIEQRKHSKR